VIYFMHLLDERKNLQLALIPATIFVLLMMNMIWSDSFRLLHMRPFVKWGGCDDAKYQGSPLLTWARRTFSRFDYLPDSSDASGHR